MSDIVKKEVCKCVSCGNEAEMMVTCSLPDNGDESGEVPKAETAGAASPPKKVKGTATCSHCGNEADMWIDL
jgi:hypothetical protein